MAVQLLDWEEGHGTVSNGSSLDVELDSTGAVSPVLLAVVTLTVVPTNFTLTYGGLPMVQIGAWQSVSEGGANAAAGAFVLQDFSGLTFGALDVEAATTDETTYSGVDIDAAIFSGADQSTQYTLDDVTSTFNVTFNGSSPNATAELDVSGGAADGMLFAFAAAASGSSISSCTTDLATGDNSYGPFSNRAAGYESLSASGAYTRNVSMESTGAPAWIAGYMFAIQPQQLSDGFNCDCEPVSDYRTLLELRTSMLIQMGYAAMAANPPPGMVAFCNEYLQSSQRQLYDKYKALHTERFYKWQMVPGQRYYGFAQQDVNTCARLVNRHKITWVGFEDLNQAWYQLIAGIDPVYYTRANITFGWPARYEIRSCIEIFPAPQAAYTLWVKGHFGLDPFVADGDTPAIDDELVLLYALARAKRQRGMADWQGVMQEATQRLHDLTAANHTLRRYIPRSAPLAPATPPRMIDWIPPP